MRQVVLSCQRRRPFGVAPRLSEPDSHVPRRQTNPGPACGRSPAADRFAIRASCPRSGYRSRGRRRDGCRGPRDGQVAARCRADGLPPARRHRRGGHPGDQGTLAGRAGRDADGRERPRDASRVDPGRSRRVPHEGSRGRRHRQRGAGRIRRRDASAQSRASASPSAFGWVAIATRSGATSSP